MSILLGISVLINLVLLMAICSLSRAIDDQDEIIDAFVIDVKEAAERSGGLDQ